VNGKEIKSLDDLAEAVKHPIEGSSKSKPKKIQSKDRARCGTSRDEAQDLRRITVFPHWHRLN